MAPEPPRVNCRMTLVTLSERYGWPIKISNGDYTAKGPKRPGQVS